MTLKKLKNDIIHSKYGLKIQWHLNVAMDNCSFQMNAKHASSFASQSSVSILPEAATEQNEGRPNFSLNLILKNFMAPVILSSVNWWVVFRRSLNPRRLGHVNTSFLYNLEKFTCFLAPSESLYIMMRNFPLLLSNSILVSYNSMLSWYFLDFWN